MHIKIIFIFYENDLLMIITQQYFEFMIIQLNLYIILKFHYLLYILCLPIKYQIPYYKMHIPLFNMEYH